ncbi:ribonuclease H-like domain-containing protein [Tanacetum coccineum]
MCDKKNSVLFTDTGCFVLSPDFKLADESQVLLKVPRKNNMYSVDMKNIVPKESLTCLVAKATLDESMLWHRRLGHFARNEVIRLFLPMPRSKDFVVYQMDVKSAFLVDDRVEKALPLLLSILEAEQASGGSPRIFKQERMIEEINQDARVTLVTPTQGEDQPEDQLGVLSAAKVLADAAKTNVHTYTRRRRAVIRVVRGK